MLALLTIGYYGIQASIDVMDKFLISRRKIKPASYAFYTVTTGALLLPAWPWFYYPLPAKLILLNLLSGALFSLTIYVFFKALSYGEVSRVVPFVFGVVPLADILISWVTGRNMPDGMEMAAIFMLIPGAVIISYHKGFAGKHIALKLAAAFLFSAYAALWQYGAQEGPMFNNFLWNRAGAAFVLVLALLAPAFRKSVFQNTAELPMKKNTLGLFALKQALGGAGFIYYSYLVLAGKIFIVNALQGFRYIFLLVAGLWLSRHRGKHLEEDTSTGELLAKAGGIGLIFAGTAILFIF